MQLRGRRAWAPIIAWGLVLAWMGVIFALSTQSTFPFRAETLLDIVLRKLGHFLEFALLGVLLFNALETIGATRASATLWALGLAGAYAITDELHQGLVPLRTPSPVDVGIDVLGAFTCIRVWRWWRNGGRRPSG